MLTPIGKWVNSRLLEEEKENHGAEGNVYLLPCSRSHSETCSPTQTILWSFHLSEIDSTNSISSGKRGNPIYVLELKQIVQSKPWSSRIWRKRVWAITRAPLKIHCGGSQNCSKKIKIPPITCHLCPSLALGFWFWFLVTTSVFNSDVTDNVRDEEICHFCRYLLRTSYFLNKSSHLHFISHHGLWLCNLPSVRQE